MLNLEMEMKVQVFALVVATGLSAAACGRHVPAYKDVNTNQPTQAAPQSSATPNEPAPAQPATTGQTSQPATTPPQALRIPAFMDVAKGYPKDLPNYPQAARINLQYGPYGDIDTFSIAMQTRDTMDQIAAFYDQVIKSNGWTVANRQIDPEYSEWVLKKKEDNEAKVTVQKDKQTNKSFIIVVARTAKHPQPAPSKPQS
jgi:hypothetical protein